MPVPLPFPGKRSKFCDSRSKSLFSFCSVPPGSVTLFYIKRLCLVSWRTWWSDALTLPYPSTSELLGLENVGGAYWCGNRIFLAIVIALKSKDFDGTLSMIGNQIIKPSCLCCQVHLFRCTPSVNKLDSCRNSQDHIVPLWKARFLSPSVTYGGSWYSRCLSRSIARLSPDRDVKSVSKLVLWTAPFSKNILLDALDYFGWA